MWVARTIHELSVGEYKWKYWWAVNVDWLVVFRLYWRISSKLQVYKVIPCSKAPFGITDGTAMDHAAASIHRERALTRAVLTTKISWLKSSKNYKSAAFNNPSFLDSQRWKMNSPNWRRILFDYQPTKTTKSHSDIHHKRIGVWQERIPVKEFNC